MYEKGCRKYEKIDNISINIINKVMIFYFIFITFLLYFFYYKLVSFIL